MPDTIDWLYRSAGADPGALYFEASKRPTPPPGERLTLRGWLRLAADGSVVPIRIDTEIRLDEEQPDDESISNVSDLIPLGVVPVRDRDVWVMEVHYTESADFALYEIGDATVRDVLRVDGGGC